MSLLTRYLGLKNRLLILGPLKINPFLLKKTLKELSPTLIILIDGGNRHKKNLLKKYQKICISVGDGDSSLKYNHLDILLPTHKDFSDLAFVVDGILKSKKKFEQISFLGFSLSFSEKRLDHLLCNLKVVQKLSNKLFLKIKMDDRFIFLPKGINSFIHRGTFSIINFTSCFLKMVGQLEYPLKKLTRVDFLSSRVLSNESDGLVKVQCSKGLIVYFVSFKLFKNKKMP